MRRQPVFVVFLLLLSAVGCSERDEDVERAPLPAEAMEEDRVEAERLFHQGMKLEEQKRMVEAYELWKKGMARDGRNYPLVNHVAWFLAVSAPKELQNHKAALPLARQAVRLSGWKRNNVIDTLAEVYFLHGKYGKAVRTQQRALLPGVEGGCSASYLRRQIRKYEAAHAEFKRAPHTTEIELERE